MAEDARGHLSRSHSSRSRTLSESQTKVASWIHRLSRHADVKSTVGIPEHHISPSPRLDLHSPGQMQTSEHRAVS